ncbi:MAG TPA: anti-sigma factor antagonist [Thiotrichaceae bacterium]|jgi:anti-sigma B factor antagonist|nr:anti-sigma factor antagonist [Thiotrichaceae bacterium]HIM07489.1 anti-sigma factor antagonist [Gammaproteobacteria bacterium]
MDINTEEREQYTIIELVGEVDLSCSPDARKSILGVLEENNNLLVDLGKVSYIDSSGIACLVEGYQMAKKQSLKFGLVGVSDAAMSVLKLARLDKVFPIFDSTDDYEKD